MFINKVETSFETAHRLHTYRGKCRHIHGHSWNVTVEIRAEGLGRSKKTPPGMVMDFSVIRRIVNEEIISLLDHTLILSAKDPLAKHLFHFEENLKVILMPNRYLEPTCENIASWCFDLLKVTKLEEEYSCTISSVTISEGDGNSCRYE